MNELRIFTSDEFGTVRTVEKDGELWFVATDVCNALELGNSRQALTRLDDDEKGVISTDTHGGKQEMATVNEPGLYALVLGSRKPEAKAFKRWITHEVIPSIRKHGAYATEETIDRMIADPDFGIKLLGELKAEQSKNLKLTAENSRLEVEKQIMAPKADYFDEIVNRNLLTNFRETAQELGVKEREFIRWLIEKKYVYRDQKGKLMPRAEKNNGLFEIKECTNTKTEWAGTQTLITPKGRETFRLLVKGI